MIADLKPYPIMRDSGVAWLREVPKGWDVLRGRQLFEIKKRISGALGHPVISVTQQGLRVKDVESGEGQLSQDYSKYQTIRVGEFAMNSMDLLTGGVGIASSLGVTSPDYRVFAIRDESRCCDKYILHVFRMLYRNRGFYSWGQGSAQLGRWRLPRKRFNDFPFPVPPFTEQAAIGRFLDWANSRLERAIRAKRKVIALLNEQKQAIIHRAVTRGLDPSVPLKPSGIPWLGDIPLHWEVRPLKAVCKIQSGITLGKDYAGQTTHEYPYLRVANVQAGHANIAVVKTIRVTKAEALRCTLQAGDVLMTEGGDPDKLGRGCVWEAQIALCLHQNHVFAVRPNQLSLEPHFLSALMGTRYARAYFESTAKQTTNLASTNKTKIGQFAVLLPKVDEQQKILTALNDETGPVNIAISRLEREIELLREYRARLVADVVTGKLDVREAAAKLPDEAASDAAGDDSELSDQTELADEEAAV